MITEGILSKGPRPEKNWKGTKFKMPYSKAIETFRREVAARPDFDPATLLVWGTYMSMTILQMMKDVEENFGPDGQKVVVEAMRKVGYDTAEEMFEKAEFPRGTTDIEKTSFVTTWVNTDTWTSVERPKILGPDEAMFDILWCPHQDTYNAFDCRVQRYLVEGILKYLREQVDPSFCLEFKWTIPAGAETCRFRLWKRKQGEQDRWEKYSNTLAQKALEKWRQRTTGISPQTRKK
jgi:hypothetical protein